VVATKVCQREIFELYTNYNTRFKYDAFASYKALLVSTHDSILCTKCHIWTLVWNIWFLMWTSNMFRLFILICRLVWFHMWPEGVCRNHHAGPSKMCMFNFHPNLKFFFHFVYLEFGKGGVWFALMWWLFELQGLLIALLYNCKGDSLFMMSWTIWVLLPIILVIVWCRWKL